MASNSEQLEGLLKQTRVLRDKVIYSAGGHSRKGVEKVYEGQMKVEGEVDALISKMGVEAKGLSLEEIDKYQEALNQLNMANAKKLKSLQTQTQVSDLQSLIWNVSCFVSKVSVMLVEAEEEEHNNKKNKDNKDNNNKDNNNKDNNNKDNKDKALKWDSHVPGYIGQLSQNCIFGLGDSWASVELLNKCSHQHVQHAALYHKFHHEVRQSKDWMIHDLSDAINNFQRLQIDKPNSDTINYFLSEFEAIHKALTHWRCSLVRLSTTASSLVPVQLRTRPLDTPLPVTALASYTAHNMLIRDGETLTLIEGGEKEYWKVSNGRGMEADVPSPLILIPPPHQGAIKALDELKFILLTYWTNAVKIYGSQYIKLLLYVYKCHYAKNELRQFESLEDWDKENILTYFLSTQHVLEKYWSSTRIYQKLLERMGVVRVVLEEDVDVDGEEGGDKKTESSKEFDCMINATPHLSDTTNLYDELLSSWECYKTTMDIHHHPESMLSLKQWSQLQYLPSLQVSQMWSKGLNIQEYDDEEEEEDVVVEGHAVKDQLAIKKVSQVTSGESDGGGGDADSLLLNVTDRLKREKVLKKAVVQQQQLKGNKTASQTITLDQGAVLTRPSKPSNDQLIEQTTTTTTTTAGVVEGVDGGGEEGSMGGGEGMDGVETENITSEEREEKQTFSISSVINPLDDQEISLDDAIYKGIIIPEEGVYKNLRTGENMPIQVAMMHNLIKVTMTTKKSSRASKSSIGLVTIKSMRKVDRPYKVISAKDTKSSKDVALNEAIKDGILDLKKGLFVDKATNKRISLKEAMSKGLVVVEYTKEATEPEIVVKRYAVRAVVDRKKKTTITFQQAIQQDIIHLESGDYTDNVTGEQMNIGEALARGFVKAKQVTENEVNYLDLDSTNQIVVDRTKVIRKKLIQPLTAIGAFRKMGGK